MVTHCEINSCVGARCESVASGWCRVCDRATCDQHRRVIFRGPERIERCDPCTYAAAEADAAELAAYRAALADIKDSIRALRIEPGVAPELAVKRRGRVSRVRRWTHGAKPVYSLRYWPVGKFTWLQSAPGGFGDHDLMRLGVDEYETVVNERGQITRRDEDEILAGRAVLAQLLSAPTATVTIAAKLRAYLA